MLRKRVIPIVLLDGFSVLKTIEFNVRRNLGSPITVLRTYNTRNVDELVLLDIDASKQKRSIDKFTIQEIAKECFMPLTVGGGIRKISDIRELLSKGADKVAINSFAIDNPKFISEASNVFGAQCIVVSVDVIEESGSYFVYSRGIVRRDIHLLEWIAEIERLGAGEILVNNVSRDGRMEGADIELADMVSKSVSLPVIYVGGVSDPADAAAVAMTKVSAVGVSSIFHFTDATPDDCKAAFSESGIPVR
jgi:imidazole glycerol-phosphate synthase subunit HisF